MPASSGRSSMSVVRRYTSASDRTRGYCGGTRDDKADAFNGAQRVVNAPLASGDVLDGPSTPVAQVGAETPILPVVTERPRRQKRRSLKLTMPSLRPGRRRSWSLPPIVASIAAVQPKRTPTSPSPRPFEGVSSLPTSPKRFWRVLRSSPKDSGSKDNIHTPVSNEIPEDARRSILGGIEGIQVTYRDSPVSEYYSIASDRIEELDTRLAFSLPEESPIKDSATCTPLELSTTLPSMSDFQEESSCAAEQKDLSSVDPAYRALLPIVYGLEEIIFNPRRRSLGEEHGDEDYTKFWETFGQLSAKEVLHAVYVIRSGALKPCIESPSQHSDLSFLTTFCALWAGLATIVAFYFYFYSL